VLNRTSELGDWDLEALGPLLVELGELGFDLEATGFSLPELDIIMSEPFEEPDGKGQEELAEPPAVPVTQLGDLWLLDEHRVLCGDATDPASYAALLACAKAQVIFTDLPWNIPIEGFVSGLGKVKHKDFAMAAGEMSPEQFADFCDTVHELAAKHLEDGGAFFSCIDWRSVDVIMAAGCKAGLKHIDTAIWNKGSGGMGTPYRSAHELVPVFVKGDNLKVNNVELGKRGRDRTNVWSYPGANRRGSSASKALSHHPTPKPVEMVEDALKDVSKRGALALDPFLGSGTTLLAAERSGRRPSGSSSTLPTWTWRSGAGKSSRAARRCRQTVS
jgi:DNA modification methylase